MHSADGGVCFGGSAGAGVYVTVAVGDGAAVGVGVTTASGVAAGVTVTAGVGDGDVAGVGVTAYSLSVVKFHVQSDSIVVPAQFAAWIFGVTRAVYSVSYERISDGIKVIVLPFVAT